MAVAEMSVMTLVGLAGDKDALFDELQRSGASQIKTVGEYALAEKSEVGEKDFSEDAERAEKALAVISAAVDELLGDRELRQRMGEKGRELAAERFSGANVVRAFRALTA